MKNALIGYTYQKHVTELLIVKMDVERTINKIEIETENGKDFDDVNVTTGNREYFFQIKDFKGIDLSNIIVSDGSVQIKGKQHKLTSSTNVLFIRDISITPNCEVLGFSAYNLSEIYIISSSRSEIDDKINDLYRNDISRRLEIEGWFNKWLDNRNWMILRTDLPSIKIFTTELREKTIDIGREHFKFSNLLLIEGKPGVGKSHLVNSLTSEYENHILYRFWTSSQDKDYEQRLKYTNFIFDFSKKIFRDQKFRGLNEICDKLKEEQKTVIIDGLDHIENYNKSEFESYIDFVNHLKDYCKVIVLSRPLQRKTEWKKITLSNWNENQTKKVLNELFHISDYDIVKQVYSITDGYPILVKYLAEHYKIHKLIPNIDKIGTIENYYNRIIDQEKGKQLLSLFLCTRSFIMKSEIESIMKESSVYVNEFIEEHPYLFEIRLNRISLFHDSFNAFLRNQDVDYSTISSNVKQYVYDSIMSQDKRFLSRFGFFDLTQNMKKEIIKRYCSIDTFIELVRDSIDFEAIQSFYTQIRETIGELTPEELEIIQYYDLSLILNIINRDHISTLNGFCYTYVNALLYNGFTEEDITSSRYLFAMLCYIRLNDATLLLNETSDDMYSTEHFYEDLQYEVDMETHYFIRHDKPLPKEKLNDLLQDKFNLHENLTYILVNLYIHQNSTGLPDVLYGCIDNFINGNEEIAVMRLKQYLNPFTTQDYQANWALTEAKRNILSHGYLPDENQYMKSSLHDFISDNMKMGSFNLRDEIHNHIRLSMQESRSIDISSISLYWTKYYQRKDASLISIDTALNELEIKGNVTLKSCINLIHEIQQVSEKGYNGLLAGFIKKYSPQGIIPFISDNFDVEMMNVSWFQLPAEYINVFPDKIFETALYKVFRYNHYSKETDLDDLKNVLYSNRVKELEQELDLMKYSIRAPNSHPIIEEFKDSKFVFSEFSPESTNNYKDDSQKRFDGGVLTMDDVDFIKKNEIKSYEVAGFSNGYYSALADIDLFKIFDKEDIRKNHKDILYNALLGKMRDMNFFHNVYYFPGNVISMIRLFNINEDIDRLERSFLRYLNLSGFELGQ